MSPMLKNIAVLSVAFALGGFVLSWMQGSGQSIAESMHRAAPLMAFGVTAGALIGLALNMAGIQVVP